MNGVPLQIELGTPTKMTYPPTKMNGVPGQRPSGAKEAQTVAGKGCRPFPVTMCAKLLRRGTHVILNGHYKILSQGGAEDARPPLPQNPGDTGTRRRVEACGNLPHYLIL